MVPSLVGKTVRDWRRAVVGWGVGLAVFAAFYLMFWPNIRDNPDLAQLKAQSLPPSLRTAFGVDDLTTGLGYLQGTIYSLVGPLLFTMAAIILGARTVAGPEDGHVMDLFLANPISRRRFVAERAAALGTVLLGYGLVLWVIPLILSQTLRMDVGVDRVSAASLGLFLLGVFFGALAFAVGAATGRGSTALAVSGTVAVAGYVIRVMADSVSWIRPLRWISPFHYDLGADPLHHGFSLGYPLVLAIASAVLVLSAMVTFDRRDVRV